MKTSQQEMLESFFKKQEGKVIPGTEYMGALTEFSKVCFDQLIGKEKRKLQMFIVLLPQLIIMVVNEVKNMVCDFNQKLTN